jgi:deoxyribodipyrimidine photo-lyase
MSRDQRVADNWALLHAQDLARGRPLGVVFTLAGGFLGATARAYDFMFRGLREMEQGLHDRGIPLFLLTGDPVDTLPRWVRSVGAGAVVTDFSPLRIHRRWKDAVASAISVPLVEVDAHNVVPSWVASPKAEYGAYTIRPKLNRLLPGFLTDFPDMGRHATPWMGSVEPVNWSGVWAFVNPDPGVPPVEAVVPGEKAASAALGGFLERSDGYATGRNDPNASDVSGLSPYFHFGHLSPQRAAWAAHRKGGLEAFLEELIVRRELSDNFCLYTADYDAVSAFPAWSRATLEAHRRDRRDFLYTREDFEAARTHDPLWNAAQTEMVARGKMHGYLRMYWAKKILEWSPSPEDALATVLALNDRYELDGRDPNGYAGAAWAVGGVHDRPWAERPVFGMVRYMNDRGCARKFDVDAYIRRNPPRSGKRQSTRELF